MIGNLFASIINALIPLVVIIGVFALFIVMLKYENARPFLAIVVVLITIIAGVYSTITLVEYYSATSQTRGSMTEYDPYEDFDIYDQKLENIAFHKNEETGAYYLEQTYNTPITFNGTNKEFVTVINNKPCYSTTSTAGKLHADTEFYVKNVDGDFMTNIDIDLDITFYANKIVLKITTNATDDNITLLNQYTQINGLRIQILDNIYTNYDILTGQPVAV